MAENDPIVSSFFYVEFGSKVKGAFREVSSMGSENEVVEYKASGDKAGYVLRKVPGRLKMNNVTLKRGITPDSMDMWNWRKEVELGKVEDARVNGTITMVSTDKESVVAKWDFVNAWPSKLTGPAPNANNNEVAIEELELVYEDYRRIE